MTTQPRDYTLMIAALERAVDRAERKPGAYNWESPGDCNCGLVAQEIIGACAWTVFKLFVDAQRELSFFGTWEDLRGPVQHCVATGMPVPLLVARMAAIGFSPKDFQSLENLSDPEICARAGIKIGPGSRSSRENFIRYARAWAQMLREQSRPLDPTPIALEAAR